MSSWWWYSGTGVDGGRELPGPRQKLIDKARRQSMHVGGIGFRHRRILEIAYSTYALRLFYYNLFIYNYIILHSLTTRYSPPCLPPS